MISQEIQTMQTNQNERDIKKMIEIGKSSVSPHKKPGEYTVDLANVIRYAHCVGLVTDLEKKKMEKIYE